MLQKLLNTNSLLYGMLAGLLFPLAGYFFLSSFFQILDGAGVTSGQGLSINFRLRTSTVIAICINMVPLRRYSRQRHAESMRGVVLITVILGVIWFFTFRNEFLPA